MAANGTPQSELYNTGYGALPNQYRDRSAEQSSTNSGNPMNYVPNFFDPMYGTQQPGLGRYTPPEIGSNGQSINGQGGYAYNLPTSYGPYGGSWGSPFSMQGPQSMQGIQQAGGWNNGYPAGGYPPQQMPGQQPMPPQGSGMSGMGIQPQQPGPQGQPQSMGGPVPLPYTTQPAPGQPQGGMGDMFNRLGGALSGGGPNYIPQLMGAMNGLQQPQQQPPGLSWQGHQVTPGQMQGIDAAHAARNAWWAAHNTAGQQPPPQQAPVPTLS